MAINITTCWKAGETTCFQKLCDALNGKEDVDAFRGFIPEDRVCWMFATGGQATGPIERMWGDNPNWCALCFDGSWEGHYQERDDAMDAAGKILGLLKEKTNLNNIGNVMWLRLRDLPKIDAVPVGDQGAVYWKVVIPLEMVVYTSVE